MSVRDLNRHLADFVRPIAMRIRMALARGVVRVIYDAHKMQLLQVDFLANETKDGIEHFQPYGFTYHPHPGAEAVAVFIGGNRDHGIVISVADRRYRLTGLEQGEVALYTDEDDGGDNKHRIILRRGRMVEVYGDNILYNAKAVLRLEGDGVEIHGRTYVQQDVHGKGERETWAGGTRYDKDTYTDTIDPSSTSTEHGLDAPAIPSDYPGEG